MKRIISIILCVTMFIAVGLAGCSQSGVSTEVKESSQASKVTQESAKPSAPKVPEGGHVAAEKVAEKPLRIIFIGVAGNPFHDEVRKGVVAAGKYLKDFNTTAEFTAVGGDSPTMSDHIAGIEAVITKKYDGMCGIFAWPGIEEYVNKAVDAGVPVINCVCDTRTPCKELFFYGQNALQAGEIAGKEIEKYMGGKGKLGVITVFGFAQLDDRVDGALDYLKKNCPDITVIGKYDNNDKAENAYDLTKDMITANPDLKCVYVAGGGAFGAAKAIQDTGYSGKAAVIGYDWLVESLGYVKSGEIYTLISQDPFGQGFDTMVMMHNYLTMNKVPEEKIIDVPPLLVHQDTLAQLVPDFK